MPYLVGRVPLFCALLGALPLACTAEDDAADGSDELAAPSATEVDTAPGASPTLADATGPSRTPDAPMDRPQPSTAESGVGGARPAPSSEPSDDGPCGTPPGPAPVESGGSGPGPVPTEPAVDPGAGGTAGSGGGAGSGGEFDGGTIGEAGRANESTSVCANADLILCEDFETTAVGDIPEGWRRRGDEVRVTDVEAWQGSRSLELGPIDSWERRIAHDADILGGEHWGRIHYKVKLPVPDAFVHSTLVALTGEGPTRGASEFRFIDTVKQAIDTPDVGSRHNFLFNVQPEDSGEFGRETSYDYTFDGEWHCVEYHVNAATQSYAFYFEGEEKLSFEDGAGNHDRSDLPEEYEELRVGWNNYQEAPPGFTAWMDDIAFDDERIGCE